MEWKSTANTKRAIAGVFKGDSQSNFLKMRTLSTILRRTNSYKSARRTCLVSMLLLFSLISATAATKTWTGATSNAWSTATNWSPASVPSSLDDITISAKTNMPVFTTGAVTIHSLNIQTGASLTVSGGTLSVIGGAQSVYGTYNVSGGTVYANYDLRVYSGGVINESAGTIQLSSSSATAPAYSLYLYSGGTINQTGGTLYVKDYRSSPGTFNQTGATALFRLAGTWRPGTSSKFLSMAGTVQFSASGTNKADFASGTKQFSSMIIDAGADPNFDNNSNKGGKIYVNGNFTNNNSGLNETTNASFTFNGTANQTITSACLSSKSTFGNLTINKTGGTVTLASNATVAGNLYLFGGTYDLSTFTSNRNLSGGTFYLSPGASLKLAGTTGGKTGSNFPTNYTTQTVSSGSTVEYYGSGQTVFATTYGNLIISSAGTKTAGGSLTIKNNFTLSTATFVGGSYTHNLAGNWTMSSGTFTNTGTIVNLNGTINQVVSSTGAFNNITVNKTSGSTTLGTDITTSTLTFTKGVLTTTSAYKLIVPSNAGVTGASQTTGWVNGNLQKYFTSATATGNTFEVGCNAYYTPVTALSFTGITTSGSMICTAVPSAHPNVCGTTITSKNIGRYWTLTRPTTGALAYTSAAMTFNWNTADNYPGLTATALKVANYYSSAWTFPTVSGTPTATTISVTGVANTGDFAVGEVSSCTTSAGFSYSPGLICSNFSTVGVTLGCGASAGTFTVSPAGLSINSTTGAINPAASSAGTYTITNTVIGSCTAKAVTTVLVSLSPSAAISYGSTNFCQSAGTISPTITGTTGGYFTSTTGLDVDYNTGQIDLTNSDPGTYTVTYNIPSSSPCTNYTTTTTITVAAANYANIGYSADAYCSNGGIVPIDFEGTTGGTFTSTAGLTLNASTGDITLTTSTTGTYTITYNGPAANGCAAFTATAPITITATSPGTISYASPLCATGAVTPVTITGTNTGTFTSSAALYVDNVTGDIDPTLSTAGTYTVTYDLGGCFSTANVTITPTPSATISYAGTPFCKSLATAQNATITGTTGGTYSASPAGLTISSTTGAITPSTSTAGTYTVTYTVAAAGGCAAYTTTTTVVITAIPTASISYAGPFCKTNATAQNPTITGTTGGTFSSTTGLIIDATTGAITPSTSTAGTYTVTYTVAAANGCSAVSATASVTINAAPSATISYAGPFCKSVSIAQAVTQTGTAGGTYSALPAGLTISSTTGAITPSTSTAGTYTITYTVAAANGCTAYTTTTSVLITAVPSATISYAGPFCKTNATAQNPTITGTTGGSFTATAGLTIDATTGAITPSTSTVGTYTVTYTVAAAGGCSAISATASVTINAAPSATISYGTTSFCKSLSTAQPVTVTGTTGGTFTALPAGLTISSTTGAITPSTSTAGTYTVTYTVAAAGGCSVYTSTTTVNIVSLPTAVISYLGTPFCTSTTAAQSVTFTGTTGGLFSSTAGLSINSTTGAITPSSSTAGTYTVTYTITGCSAFSATTSVTINAAPSAAITYGGGLCTTTAFAAVSRTGTAGGTYSSTLGLTLNPLTGDITPLTSSAGTYAVTYSIAAANGCAAYSTNTSVTVSSPSSATISYPSTALCTNGGTSTPTITGATGGSFTASPVGLSINSTTGVITPASSSTGTYTITYTPPVNGACAGSPATFSITVSAAPSATISYGTGSYCKSGSVSASVTGTTGGAFSSTTGLSVNSSTGLVDLANSTAGTYTITYSIAATTGCGAFTTTAPITIIAPGTWTGAVSTAWTNASNWQCGILPDNTTDVTIPSGLTNYPSVTTTTPAAKSISLGTNTTITVSNGWLKIAGSVSGTGKIIATQGKVEFNGSSAQTIPAGLFTLNTVKDLIITNATGVTLAGNLRLSNSLSFGNVNNSTFNTGGYLTLGSTSSANAYVTDLTNNGVNSGNNIIGNVTIERYVVGKRAYRFLSAPVNTTTSIKANWMENVNNTGQGNNNNPNPGYGTHITGAGGAANGFDPTGLNNPSMHSFDHATQTWSGIPNTSGTFSAGKGYRIMIRGSRSVDLTQNAPAPSATTLRATGTLVTGNVVFTKTGGGGTSGMPSLTSNVGSYSMIANPYASAVNWASLDKTDVSSTIYIFDPTVSGTNGRGAFVAFNALLNANNLVSSFISKDIQQGQAFFVQTTGPNPSITFKEAYKSGIRLPVFRSNNDIAKLSIGLQLPRQLGTDSVADGTAVFFSENFSDSIADDDSYKFSNQDENVAINRGGTLLSMEGRKNVTATDTIQLKTWNLAVGSYNFKISMSNFAPDVDAYFYDEFNQSMTKLANNDSALLQFDITSAAASAATDRFKIVFRVSSAMPLDITNVNAYTKNRGTQVDWQTESEVNVDKYEVERSNNGIVFKKIGTVQAENKSKASYSLVDAEEISADRYYRVKAVEKSQNIKYSRIVKVKAGVSAGTISVVPNPISGNSINIVFSNMEEGQYKALLFNKAGQIVYSGHISYGGGIESKVIKVSSTLPGGVYQLSLMSNENKVYNTQVLVE